MYSHVCIRKQKLEDSRTSFKKALDSLIVLASLQVHCSMLSVLLCVAVCRCVLLCVAVCRTIIASLQVHSSVLSVSLCVAVCRNSIATLQLCYTSCMHVSSTIGQHERKNKIYIHTCTHEIYFYIYVCTYGVALVSRIDKIIGLFCKRAS